ncbi:hypothetical protein AKJ16_DCAP16986 [Drosera capensis]
MFSGCRKFCVPVVCPMFCFVVDLSGFARILLFHHLQGLVVHTIHTTLDSSTEPRCFRHLQGLVVHTTYSI